MKEQTRDEANGHIEIGDGSEPLTYDSVPAFDSPQELADYCQRLIDHPHDYNTSAVAPAMAALAAFRLFANVLGITGFQAGYAALAIPGAINSYSGPYGIVKAEDMLYPQYGGPTAKAREYEESWREWARDEARKLIAQHDADGWISKGTDADGDPYEFRKVHPDVEAHWRKLACDPPRGLPMTPSPETRFHIELVDCENVLLREIADQRMKREDVAQTYAMAMRSSERDTIDWGTVNQAIIARWSMNALKWIKERAWKLVRA